MTPRMALGELSTGPALADSSPGKGDVVGSRRFRVLIIEDDRDLNNLLKYTLEVTKDYEVLSHFEGGQAFDVIQSVRPDLVILDVMLPGADGTEVLRRIRADAHLRILPVILLTARSHEQDKVEGFEAGADDYITKPFSPKELLLRVQALLRRSAPAPRSVSPLEESSAPVQERTVTVGLIRILPDQYKVLVGNDVVPLTSTEFQLLLYLAERAGRLQSREALLQRVWGYEGSLNTRTVDTHIKRLRQKLGAAGGLIETVHGFGYQLAIPPAE